MSDTAFEPFVMEHQEDLYILWWTMEKVQVNIKELTETAIQAEIVVTAPTQKDFQSLVKGAPPMRLVERKSTITVEFPEVPIIVSIHEFIKTNTFVGIKARRSIAGKSIKF
mgnify:CR=1 FL=1